jgi:hypothetical protein
MWSNWSQPSKSWGSCPAPATTRPHGAGPAAAMIPVSSQISIIT